MSATWMREAEWSRVSHGFREDDLRLAAEIGQIWGACEVGPMIFRDLAPEDRTTVRCAACLRALSAEDS
jgi:hypothetical protein